jgi:hypothetical protein
LAVGEAASQRHPSQAVGGPVWISAGLWRASSARNGTTSPCLGSRHSPWAVPTRHSGIEGRARHDTIKSGPPRPRARAGLGGPFGHLYRKRWCLSHLHASSSSPPFPSLADGAGRQLPATATTPLHLGCADLLPSVHGAPRRPRANLLPPRRSPRSRLAGARHV